VTHRILLSGPGLIGKRHAEIIEASGLAKLVGIVAPDTQENRSYASSCNTELFSDFSEALVQTKPTATVISSPNKFHFEQARISLVSGVPALVEKPLTEDVFSSGSLVELVSQTNVPLLVGHHRTHSPLIDVARSFMQSADFGRLVAFQGSALFHKPKDYFEAGPWRSELGGGPLLINLIHEIGLWRIMCGEIVEVNAIVTNKQRGFVVEDSAAINILFQNNAIGSFVLSDAASSAKSWELTTGENPMFPRYEDEACYHFAGTQGSLDFPTMKTKSYGSYQSWTLPLELGKLEVQKADPLVRQFEHFINVIEEVERPLVSALDGYKNILILSAIRNSALTQRTIRIDDKALRQRH
jgi:predicted dehydrogenase